LRNIAEAKQMTKVAAGAEVQRESLYRMLSVPGNPRLSSLLGVLKALGLQLTVAANVEKTFQSYALRDTSAKVSLLEWSKQTKDQETPDLSAAAPFSMNSPHRPVSSNIGKSSSRQMYDIILLGVKPRSVFPNAFATSGR